MNALRDKSVTTQESPPSYGLGGKLDQETGLRVPKRRKTGKPAAIVKFGSAAVPIFQCRDGNSTLFILWPVRKDWDSERRGPTKNYQFSRFR
jgi:hypothetical protein